MLPTLTLTTLFLVAGCTGTPAPSTLATSAAAPVAELRTYRHALQDAPQAVSAVVYDDSGRLRVHAAIGAASALGPHTRAEPGDRSSAAPRSAWCVTVRSVDDDVIAQRCADPIGAVHLPPDGRLGHAPAHVAAGQATLRVRLPWRAGAQLTVTAMGQQLTWRAQ